MARVSIKIIPKILDTSSSASDLLRKWRLVYQRGHIRGPAIALASSLFYAYAAYAKNNLGLAPTDSLAAASTTALMLPYTWIVMAPGVNQRLLAAGTEESKFDGSTEELKSLIKRHIVNKNIKHFLSAPVPDFADKEWADEVTKTKSLLEKLTFHEAMQPNLQQTYMTPAASKNRVYFMWDFVGRTLGILYGQVNPGLPEDMSEQEAEAWQDAIGRSMFSGKLILDDKPGLLNEMVEMAYPDQQGKHPEIGAEVLALARALSP
ncbi:MAG: hypothetical protein Q9167_005487 [Letrouitia subvulpina]